MSRILACSLLLLSLILNGTGTTNAQQQEPDESLWIGMDLRIGMDKEVVLQELRKSYTVTNPDPDRDSWTIWSKYGSQTKLVGVIAFSEGRLTWISKSWGNFRGSEAQELARALAGVISNLNKEGKSVAIVKAESGAAPGEEYSAIFLTFGEKEVIVNIARSREFGDSVSIQEILSD